MSDDISSDHMLAIIVDIRTENRKVFVLQFWYIYTGPSQGKHSSLRIVQAGYTISNGS